MCVLMVGCGEEIGRINVNAIGETKETTVRVKGGEEIHLRTDFEIKRGGPRKSGVVDMAQCWRWEVEFLHGGEKVGELSCDPWHRGGTCSHRADHPGHKNQVNCSMKGCVFTPKQSGDLAVRTRLVALDPCGYEIKKSALIIAK